MQLLTNELGQQVDVLQEFKNFALPASRDTQEVCLYAAVLSPGTSGVNLMDKVNRKKNEKKETFKRCYHYLCGGNSGRSCTDSCRICKPYYQQHEAGAD